MTPEEKQQLLVDYYKGRKKNLIISAPSKYKANYQIEVKQIFNWARDYISRSKLIGIIAMGSAVGARYETVQRRRLFGLLRYNQTFLVFDNGRRPNDIDLFLVFDDKCDNGKETTLSAKELSADPTVEMKTGDGYLSYTRTQRMRGELDLISDTWSGLQEKFDNNDPLAHHIHHKGVLLMGVCPLGLKSPVEATATGKVITLSYPKS